MNVSHDGLSVWYATPDAPAPPDPVTRRTGASLTVGVRPVHPSNTVEVHYRVDGGFDRRLSAYALPPSVDSDAQYFRATFPVFPSARRVEYWPVLSCAGRQAPPATSAPRFASSFGLTDDPPPVRPAAGPPQGPSERFLAELSYVARITVVFDVPQVIGPTPEGLRIDYFALHGTARGPRLSGVILPRAHDSLLIRRDGVGVIRVRAAIRTDDDALLSVEYTGSLELGENGYERALGNQFPSFPPAVVTPRVVTEHGRYAWLNRAQCLGVGRVRMRESTFEYDLYAVAPSLRSGLD